jgi:hypothetical protein
LAKSLDFQSLESGTEKAGRHKRAVMILKRPQKGKRAALGLRPVDRHKRVEKWEKSGKCGKCLGHARACLT